MEILLVVIALAAIFLISIYNSLVTLKVKIKEAW
ncbi:MAG: hypothetical protein ACD_24C00399G0001, partial [uncultured bacterium]